MHNERVAGTKRSTEFQHALAAGETVTGLIVATTMVYPDRKIAGVKAKSVVKRMKEKAFAASVSRENILECEKIGIPLEDFVELSLNAMSQISDRLGIRGSRLESRGSREFYGSSVLGPRTCPFLSQAKDGANNARRASAKPLSGSPPAMDTSPSGRARPRGVLGMIRYGSE